MGSHPWWQWLWAPATVPFWEPGKKEGQQGAEAPLPTPESPDVAAAEEAAANNVQRRKAGQTRTTFTSPLGAAGQAEIARKTLLGQ